MREGTKGSKGKGEGGKEERRVEREKEIGGEGREKGRER